MDKVNLHITRKVLFEKFSIKNDMEGLFLSFLDGCEMNVDEQYPNSIFYVKNGKVLFRQELKNKYFSISNNSIWSVFYSKYCMDNQQIQVFMKGMLEEHLKLVGYTLTQSFTIPSNAVGRTFKM